MFPREFEINRKYQYLQVINDKLLQILRYVQKWCHLVVLFFLQDGLQFKNTLCRLVLFCYRTWWYLL